MSKYVVVSNGLVTNIVVADSKEVAEEVTRLTCIDYPEGKFVKIGWTWDGTTLVDPDAQEDEPNA